jgi:hypothetical protein
MVAINRQEIGILTVKLKAAAGPSDHDIAL